MRAAAIGTRIAPAGPLQTDLTNLDVLFPASDVNGRVVREHRFTDGIGVPLVGWKKTSPVGMPREKFLLPNGLPYNITVTLAFDGSSAPVWHFVKRWKQDDVLIGGTSHTLGCCQKSSIFTIIWPFFSRRRRPDRSSSSVWSKGARRLSLFAAGKLTKAASIAANTSMSFGFSVSTPIHSSVS